MQESGERMRRTWAGRCLGWLLLGSAVACAGVVDADALQEDCATETELCCSVDQKICTVESDTGAVDECVLRRDPEFGCSAEACDPCDLPNAQAAVCNNAGTCAIATCLRGYSNCDGQPGNGCEIQTDQDMNNCGVCGNSCLFEHAIGECVDRCRFISCRAGWANCSALGLTFSGGSGEGTRTVSRGEDCETDITVEENCGGCGVRCTAEESCVQVSNEVWECQ
jgi:hypothetical protein